MTEHRNYQRINFRTEAAIEIADKNYRCDLVDLALQGALFKIGEELPITIGSQVALKIYLTDSDINMEFTGELLHQHGDYYGFLFVAEDAESMGHLRRLLELNFGDAEQAEDEFRHWLKRDSSD